jgi:hypothetical protein
MKARTLGTMAGVLVALAMLAQARGKVYTKTLWSAAAFTNTEVKVSEVVDLDTYDPDWQAYSLQVMAVGANTGGVSIAYELSNDGVNYAGTNEIVSAFGTNSGPSATGVIVQTFTPTTARYLRLRATATEDVPAITAILGVR